MALVHTAGTGFASDDGGFVEIEAAATGGASPVGTLRSFGADWSGARRGGIDEVPQAYGQLACESQHQTQINLDVVFPKQTKKQTN